LSAQKRVARTRRQDRCDVAPARAVSGGDGIDDLAGFALEAFEPALFAMP
jgi:hypothetical protein